MCVCTYVCMYVCVYVCMYACMCVYVRTYVYLRVFENRVLRRIFGPKITGGGRKLHNEELNDLYCSSNITG